MAIVQVDSKGISKERMEQEEKNIHDKLMEANEKGLMKLDSLIIQEHSGVSNFAPADCPLKTLFGPTHIHENLMGLKFRVSANAFFQVNTKSAEILYSKVADFCTKSHEITLLDICCGTGTIGLSLAKHVNKVIGIEMCEEAVVDARENAQLNGIKNAEFIVGKAEDVLKDILKRPFVNLVAIVDPPRAGLHMKTVKAIRACATISSLIYISCDKNGLLSNASSLCRPSSKKLKGVPFKPKKALGVDLFPHTDGVERIVLFERDKNQKLIGKKF